ncbi:uncharacterized protein MONOS_1711 [Monocercomonoides exilis]|uniref:uncharacterized protein n=1 Tax=Monocercomonoides exilis TaxID=2049356 RepID=UPI00355A9EB3|nr:hypothetical protein MONOS_1711 [Monocercomonoides exilis]|eukprot:MONOS_1711.1-p1 / transcript=MONOS_1711.1 / gene=MONOS_1711 / organism=Monocercomonoides_exilis_PA203 / gene_product=unspecified product / transcript_product=unspecified product / location=Mono_scaffold00031:163205-168713(-) / protein_length=1578 / sequence_SO=supercontig / SO=protein_coding / is_pseudo=false
MTIDKNNISDCYSSSASPRITRCNDGSYKCTDLSDLSSWLRNNENNYQITADYSVGIDHEQCGFAPFCRSIKYSLGRSTSNSNKTLILRPSVFKEEQISISSNEFSVCGLSKNECVVQSASSSLPVINVASGSFCVQKVTMLQGNAESGTSKPFVVMDGDGSLSMEECEISSVDSKLLLEVSFMQIFGGNVELSGVGISGMNFISDSLISFNVNQSGSVLHVVNTNFTSIQRESGSGGIIERNDASTGSVVVENCLFENVSAGKDGGGLGMRGEWKGELIVNGTTMFEGCCAGSLEEKGRGGGLFINVDSTESDFTIYESVIFSEENPNKAFHGSDVFVQCGSGLLLDEIIDQASFGFFKDGNCMNNEEKLCGCEDGTSLPVIPLCVYLCDFESPISVDERSGADHSHCGYSVFCCSTIDFCVRERVNELVNSVEVISSASIKNPFVVPLFQTSQISISSSSASSSSSQYPLVNVGLTDSISTDCHNVIQCSGSFSLSFLSFALPRVLPSSMSSIIQSSIFLSLSNISIAFSADSLASSVAFSLIHVSGGELELTGLVVSEDITFTALSPINVNGASRVAVEGCTLTEMANEGGSGGCMTVETSGGGTISIKNTNISSKCKNEEGLRGGGMMILIGSGGSLEMKNVNLSECEVPSEDVVDGGKGMGGGMFVALPEEIEKFVMEGMTFEGCNAWKGKNMFVSGWDLREVVNKDHFKWEMSSEELESLDELCGWEGMTTGEEYEIPLVVYLWSNWSGKGFVSKEKGGGFSGCGYSEAPCSSIDHMIKMRFSPVALEKSIIKGKNQHVSEKDAGEKVVLQMGISSFSNITSSNSSSSNSHVVESACEKTRSQLLNCSFERCFTPSEKGSLVEISSGASLSLQSCELIGCEDEHQSEKNGADEDVCKWTGSLVDVCEGLLEMKDTSITNSSKGGLSISGGSAVIESCLFENNSKSIERYRSARRNVFCTGSGTLNVVDLKGGDGWERNTSLWILNEGCKLLGIAAERSSEFFIPTLKSVETTQKEDIVELTFRGTLLLPCNLGFQIVSKINNVSSIETHAFAEDEFVSEEEVQGKIGSSLVSSAPTEAEVAVCILFGHVSNPSSTEPFVLKNKSESEPKGDEKIVEGGKKEKSIWPIIVIVLVVILLIVLIIAVAFIVRWRKQKRRTKDLREIVNDTVRKDPKLIEMVTMEMSPEDQWRRAEREAEKKNEERMKKRVYEKSLGHSESSEHLLSESDSTEYILGRDSDKIPEWMLEKVDEKEEEEEVRKGSPSPSISSTSTTDTSDTESTFVRGEDLCPTTSSMSNLVDAMACSSPHEKLIVDLRDSMFMLLHGRNEKKEMAIGTLQEREQTAAQILFWVANLALRSFDEMENPLQSLSNLSPHVVLFSEHMVICIVMHSDCSSSSDDSDSSSISSTTTIATSSSDCSCANGNGRGSPPPSSAFEDDDDNRKECMRWKAPELMMNKNMGATKSSVSFSIGIMLWECLTLQIPFGEYEAEVAGKKIVNGERPEMGMAEESTLGGVLKNCMLQTPSERPSLVILKREFIQRFPAGAVVMTVSDAVDIDDETGDCEESNFSSLIEQ